MIMIYYWDKKLHREISKTYQKEQLQTIEGQINKIRDSWKYTITISIVDSNWSKQKENLWVQN